MTLGSLAWAALKLAWNAAALIAISAAAGYAMLWSFSRDGPVWTASNLRVITTTIPAGGRVTYMVDVVAHESCPGDVVTVMSSKTNHGPPATVTFRRPVVQPGRSMKDVTVAVELPDSVTPGDWHYVSSVDSRCPTRRQLDETVEFDVKVTPS